MSAATRQRTPSVEIEQALVDAAVRMLDRDGPEGLSVRKLAAEAGVAPMGVYNHFDGKNGVIDAVFRRGFERLRAAFAEVAPMDDPLEALRELCRRYRRLGIEHPTTYEVMFMRSVPGFEPSEESATVAASSFDELVRAVERGMREDALAPGDAASVAQQIWAAGHGVVSLELAGICLVSDMGTTADELVETMLRGLAPRAD